MSVNYPQMAADGRRLIFRAPLARINCPQMTADGRRLISSRAFGAQSKPRRWRFRHRHLRHHLRFTCVICGFISMRGRFA
jgi:hypothetical protein